MDAPPDASALPLDSSSIVCVWVGGFLANRPALLDETDLPETASDRQLLEALHRRHGDQLPSRLFGSAAFVLWDGVRRRLLLARDRLGLTGLYARPRGRRLEVSDRLDSLLDDPLRVDQLNGVSIAVHLEGGAPLPGSTFHNSVRALPAGSAMTVTPDSTEVTAYWAPRLRGPLRLGSDAEYAEALRGLLLETVSSYAPEDRIGIAVSGGLDSGSAAAALRHALPSLHLAAFSSVSPEEPTADESALTRTVCERLGLPLTEVRSERCFPLRDGIPVGQESPYCFYYSEIWDALFEEARRARLSVMISGGGGDHLFGGFVSSLPDLIMTGHWGKAAHGLFEQKRRTGLNLFQLVRRSVLGPIFRAYSPWWKRRAQPPRPWLSPSCRAMVCEALPGAESPGFNLPGRIHRLRLFDASRISQVCESLNRQGAGRGIEVRHPLFDHRLVEFALTLPSNQTFRNGVDKFLLRGSMGGILPEEVLAQRGKTAPGAILHRSVAERRREYVSGLTRKMRSAELGFVEEAPLRRAIQEYVEGKHRDAGFWPALTLEAWLRRYF